MSKKRRSRPTARDEPAQKRSVIGFWNGADTDSLECRGYTTLAHNPEVCTAVDTIARLIGSMTIHLMQNTDNGDIRVINDLSRRVDIAPNKYMTRSNFIQWIVKTMFLEGNGNAVVWPRTENGFIRELTPIPPAFTAFIPDVSGYKVVISGKEYDPSEVLHFVANPGNYYPWLGQGYKIVLSDVADNLKQATATEKGFMSSKWKPSLVIRVDGLIEQFSNPAGRQVLLDEYIKTGSAGEPWIIPADQFDVQQIKPLSLSDLALADFVKLDKQTVASILGVPPFVLGVGNFDRYAWNNFINTTIMPIAQNIQQELTRKLLYSPGLYFRFNAWSLYAYSIDEMVSAGAEMVDRMALRRNEWRGWMGLPPDGEMDELLALENYIPADKLGDQAKLNGGGNN